MTKEALRTQYTALGWEVAQVTDWVLVSSVEGKVKYDLNVVSPENVFSTVQAVVTDDGGAGEDAVAEGVWKETLSFATELRTFLDTEEIGAVFAIATKDVNDAEEVAEVDVYLTVVGGIEKKSYGVKRREGVFSFEEIITV